ncbi:hypothetical protein BDV09DRAFT_180448 [Aspergillus tetrazonus]
MPGLERNCSNKQEGRRWDNITTLYAKTDSSRFKKIHPETLEPIGLAEQMSSAGGWLPNLIKN